MKFLKLINSNTEFYYFKTLDFTKLLYSDTRLSRFMFDTTNSGIQTAIIRRIFQMPSIVREYIKSNYGITNKRR